MILRITLEENEDSQQMRRAGAVYFGIGGVFAAGAITQIALVRQRVWKRAEEVQTQCSSHYSHLRCRLEKERFLSNPVYTHPLQASVGFESLRLEIRSQESMWANVWRNRWPLSVRLVAFPLALPMDLWHLCDGLRMGTGQLRPQPKEYTR